MYKRFGFSPTAPEIVKVLFVVWVLHAVLMRVVHASVAMVPGFVFFVMHVSVS